MPENSLPELTDYCLHRFREGKGVSIIKGDKRIFIFPEFIADDAGGGIVIVHEGGGSYVYNGKTELNQYLLVSAGFPLRSAIEISELINAVLQEYTRIAEVSGSGTKNFSLTHKEITK